jgi:hypothetical protein
MSPIGSLDAIQEVPQFVYYSFCVISDEVLKVDHERRNTYPLSFFQCRLLDSGPD